MPSARSTSIVCRGLTDPRVSRNRGETVVSRTPRLIGAAGAFAVAIGMTMIGASGAAGAGSAPAYSRVAGSVAPFAASAQVIGAVPSSRPLTVQLWLRPALAAAERTAPAVSTPASPLYHRYLS